ncbi:putative RNA polymerase sigma factor FecI [compost metagenome]
MPTKAVAGGQQFALSAVYLSARGGSRGCGLDSRLDTIRNNSHLHVPGVFMSAVEPTFQRAIHELYSEHHGWLFGWLRRKLRCPQNAADTAQDTFLRILGSRDSLVGIREPRAFLSTTARRLIIDKARRQHIEDAYLRELALTVDVLEGHQSPEQILTTLEALEQIAFVLEGLSDKVRQAFVDYYLDEQTQVQIARRLEVSERMVRKYLLQALMHCNQALDV